MAEYEINGKKIELDTGKSYLDFCWEDKKPQLIQINLEKMLGEIQSGKIPVDKDLKKYMQELKRWKIEAPRKRNLREMRREGYNVLTTDALFEQDGGEIIIGNLKNTGVFAAYFLREVYGNQ